MRIILLTLLLTSLSDLAQAQLWEVADQRSEGIWLDHSLPVGGGRWAIMGRTGTQGNHMLSVYCNDGSLAWEEVSPFAYDEDLGQVVLMPDSGLLCVGGPDGCAYFGPESRIARYASDGTLLWERLAYPLNGLPFTMAAKGPINRLAIASSDSVCIMDMDGIVTGGFPVPISEYVNGMAWATDSTLFMVCGTALMLVSLDGTQLATAEVGYVLDTHWDGQQLLVLANNYVYRFDHALVPLGSVPMPFMDTYSRISDAGNDSLFVNTANGLYALDASGNSSLVFSWPALPNLVTTGCAVRDGTVLAVGNTDISDRSTGIVRTLSMAGDAVQHDQDVEVLVHLDAVWTEFTGYPSYPYDWFANVTGLVVNHGVDTLRSVVLSMWYSIPDDFMFCEQPANRIDTSGLALAPGDTAWLHFSDVAVILGAMYAAGPVSICIAALAPDRLADRHPEDNTACGSASVPVAVAESDVQLSVRVLPNPASGKCVLSGLNAMGTPVHVRIMDLSGRPVVEQNSLGQDLQLDISSLAPATYLVVAEGSDRRAMVKLVVERP